MTTTEILRIKTARDTIRAKLVSLGLAESASKIDVLATVIDEIPNNGAVSASVKTGETYSIPRGYHNGSGTVSGVSGGGSYTLQSKTVTPTKKQQSVTPDSGYFGLSDVTVNAIPSTYQDVSSVTATAGDVLANKLFVRSDGTVTAGTMVNNGTLNASVDGLTVMSYTIPSGYTSGGTVSLTDDIEQALADI